MAPHWFIRSLIESEMPGADSSATVDTQIRQGIRSDIMRQSARKIETPDVQAGAREIAGFKSSDATPRMLIADDDPSIVRLLADHCARLGFDFDTVSDGIQAFLRTQRVKPDILVIDVNMPEVDGLSVCAHLLDLDRMPANVIVITASKDPDTRKRCEGLGAYYACKGADFWNDLEAALAKICPRMAGRIWQSGAHAPAPTTTVKGWQFGLGKPPLRRPER
jgi:CheY-like chemotaxis protein